MCYLCAISASHPCTARCLHSHLLSSTGGSRGAVLTSPASPRSVMCPAWMSRQLEPWGTVGAHFCQSSQCLGLTDCTCACVCSSGCLLCAWGGAGLAQKEWMGGPGAAAVGRDCGSRMSQAPCWETERHCHILQNFPYFGCASHQGSLGRAVLCLCPASGYQGAAVAAEHLLTPADICQGLSVGRSLPKALLCECFFAHS